MFISKKQGGEGIIAYDMPKENPLASLRLIHIPLHHATFAHGPHTENTCILPIQYSKFSCHAH